MMGILSMVLRLRPHLWFFTLHHQCSHGVVRYRHSQVKAFLFIWVQASSLAQQFAHKARLIQ